MRKKEFWYWLKDQKGRDDPVGDLVKDLLQDRCLPRSRATFGGILRHLRDRHSVDNAVLVALRQAQKEYEQV